MKEMNVEHQWNGTDKAETEVIAENPVPVSLFYHTSHSSVASN